MVSISCSSCGDEYALRYKKPLGSIARSHNITVAGGSMYDFGWLQRDIADGLDLSAVLHSALYYLRQGVASNPIIGKQCKGMLMGDQMIDSTVVLKRKIPELRTNTPVKDTADLSLRSDAHCNACTDEAHAEPGIARNELSIDVPFPKDGEEEGE